MASADYEMWSDKWHEERDKEIRAQRSTELFNEQTKANAANSAKELALCLR